jgi:hypothetical protein
MVAGSAEEDGGACGLIRRTKHTKPQHSKPAATLQLELTTTNPGSVSSNLSYPVAGTWLLRIFLDSALCNQTASQHVDKEQVSSITNQLHSPSCLGFLDECLSSAVRG